MEGSEISEIKFTAPIIDSLGKRFLDSGLVYDNKTLYLHSFGNGGYYTAFRVAHPTGEYNPTELTKWFDNLLNGFDLKLIPAKVVESISPFDSEKKIKTWLYYPQAEGSKLIYSENEVNRRNLVYVGDNEFTVAPLRKNMVDLLSNSSEGLMQVSQHEVHHNVSIIGYPERKVLDLALQGRLGARNFLGPEEAKL